MAKDTATQDINPSLTRWYIDTRPLTASTQDLPLLTTLQSSDQTAVQRFYHLKDRHMSLASNLLKYLFIHQTCRVPWSSIIISRTPDPHKRPCYIPEPQKPSEGFPTIEPINIEFNVSHQNSMVAIAGTTIPAPSNSSDGTDPRKPEVGIDISCPNERKDRSDSPQNLTSLRSHIDIFAEVFSAGELASMKSLHGAPEGLGMRELVDYGNRLFYTYWALKEAYIKMTGEALLASWLKELEFHNVVAPAAVGGGADGEGKFGEMYRGVQTTLYRGPVEDVRLEVVALEDDYFFATAARGGGIGAGSRPASDGDGDQDPWKPFMKLDIERDIRPCATGVCDCLTRQDFELNDNK